MWGVPWPPFVPSVWHCGRGSFNGVGQEIAFYLWDIVGHDEFQGMSKGCDLRVSCVVLTTSGMSMVRSNRSV